MVTNMADEKTPQESPVEVQQNYSEVQGQAQEKVPYPDPHDGVHVVHEVVAVTDKVIKDVNHPLAVQVPEGVGASTYGHYSPLGEALSAGTPQEQFDRDQEAADKAAKADAKKS